MRRRSDDGPRARAIAVPAPRDTFGPFAWRGLLLLAVTAALLLLAALSANAAPAHAAPPSVFPDVIPLPTGWQGEGIAVGRGHEFYVGSLANGAIIKGDLRTGATQILAPGEAGRRIAGLKVDERSNYIWAAGTLSGQAYVFDANTGALLQTYQLATSGPTFINDVVITRDAVYFTDSQQPVFYRIPLGPGGSYPGASDFETIPLSGDYEHAQGFNANGIAATPNGKWLIIVQSATASLFRVDPESGDTEKIDLGGASVPNGDGLLLHGKTLYVVQNQLNRIAVIELNADLTAGTIVDTITDTDFKVPTTIARFGSSLYAVNARFDVPMAERPNADFAVVKVSR